MCVMLYIGPCTPCPTPNGYVHLLSAWFNMVVTRTFIELIQFNHACLQHKSQSTVPVSFT